MHAAGGYQWETEGQDAEVKCLPPPISSSQSSPVTACLPAFCPEYSVAMNRCVLTAAFLGTRVLSSHLTIITLECALCPCTMPSTEKKKLYLHGEYFLESSDHDGFVILLWSTAPRPSQSPVGFSSTWRNFFLLLALLLSWPSTSQQGCFLRAGEHFTMSAGIFQLAQWRGSATGISWLLLTMHKTPTKPRAISPKMTTVPRLRNPAA
jgi:hypothetical protein